MDPEDVDENALQSREPSVEDLLELCRELNALGARYLVVGGFAINAAGYPRRTGDVDLLLDTELENEARVYQALEILPDKAVRELKPGEVSLYNVVRVADEIVVDLMKSACGIEYAEAARDIVIRMVARGPDPLCLASIALANEVSASARQGHGRPGFFARILSGAGRSSA